MTRARIKPSEAAQAQRFARELAESPVIPAAEASTNGEPPSGWDILDRLDHNLDDLRDGYDEDREAWLGDDG